jgi:two-component system sensor histidine kinase KdpD
MEPSADERAREHAELLSIVSHDIRAPLGVILAAISELTNPRVGTLTEEQRGLVLLVRRSSERLNRLAGNVQFLKRIVAGEVTLARQATDLRDVARRAVESFEKSGELGKKVHATLRVPDDRVGATGDAELLVHATTNLVANAIRAARSEVVVTALVEDGVPTLLVDDDGPGISPALLPVLFERGSGDPSGPSMPGVQRGLGLVVVRGIVAAHGAALSGDNRADAAGKTLGARLRLALPEAAVGAQL